MLLHTSQPFLPSAYAKVRIAHAQVFTSGTRHIQAVLLDTNLEPDMKPRWQIGFSCHSMSSSCKWVFSAALILLQLAVGGLLQMAKLNAIWRCDENLFRVVLSSIVSFSPSFSSLWFTLYSSISFPYPINLIQVFPPSLIHLSPITNLQMIRAICFD